ncbi:MAG: methionine gamma-lyase family protein [Oscillospiraceae bacterium]|jgi:cystathionine beta-lyase family protein involved in aluminum resistance|nr:methionine gamma-lyase family protein [Oscillospiraceae bacterium]
MSENEFLRISPQVRALAEEVIESSAARFREIDAVAEINTRRMLEAFARHRVSEACFAGSEGYGYGDRGRETLDKIYADVFGGEAALVRTGFVNGTHAITAALFGALRPGDTLLSVTGAPYDTIRSAIGISGEYSGSLRDWGVKYRETPLMDDWDAYLKSVARAAEDKTVAAVLIQRSRGYSPRRALGVDEISEIAAAVRSTAPRAAVIIDNCYGEFTETREPAGCGADLIAGSLIKNPGGGLAPTGGYVVGRENYVTAAAHRLTSPGIGGECGATLGVSRQLFQGFFLAPHVVAQALKTAEFCAGLLEKMGFDVSPRPGERRRDIIQSVRLGSQELVRKFCAGIQASSPVDSFVTPEPWAMPGYDCDVIMAAGAFIGGASIELSADAPMREPYTVYLQGGLTFEAGKLGIMAAASRM